MMGRDMQMNRHTFKGKVWHLVNHYHLNLKFDGDNNGHYFVYYFLKLIFWRSSFFIVIAAVVVWSQLAERMMGYNQQGGEEG